MQSRLAKQCRKLSRCCGFSRNATGWLLVLGLLGAGRASAQVQFHCLTNAGGITITGAAGSDADLDIPEQIAGRPVKAIASSAFSANPCLRSVRLASSVASIGANAFGSCSSLTRVTIAHQTAAPADSGAAAIASRPYTVTAFAHSNYLFSNWVASVDGGPLVVVATTPSCTFTLQPKLKLLAQFVPNRFLAAAGTYNGLFWDEKRGVALGGAGFATIKITASQGKLPAFSASLSFAGETVGCSGLFDLAGNGVSVSPVWLKQDTNACYQLVLNLPPDGPLTGVLRRVDGSWSAVLSADRAEPVSCYAGQYTLALPGATNAATGPGGDGYGLVTVTTNGLLKVTGALGDGTAFSQKVPVSANGDWPLFAAMYAATATNNVKVKGGALLGWMRLTPTLAGTLYHFKLAGLGPLYPKGFTNEFVPLTSHYSDPTLSGARVIDLTEGSNGVVVFGGRELACPVSLSPLNKFAVSTSVAAGITNKLSMSVAVRTGKLTGALTTNGILAAALQGVILQNTNAGCGYFLAATNSGAFRLQGQ